MSKTARGPTAILQGCAEMIHWVTDLASVPCLGLGVIRNISDNWIRFGCWCAIWGMVTLFRSFFTVFLLFFGIERKWAEIRGVEGDVPLVAYESDISASDALSKVLWYSSRKLKKWLPPQKPHCLLYMVYMPWYLTTCIVRVLTKPLSWAHSSSSL